MLSSRINTILDKYKTKKEDKTDVKYIQKVRKNLDFLKMLEKAKSKKPKKELKQFKKKLKFKSSAVSRLIKSRLNTRNASPEPLNPSILDLNSSYQFKTYDTGQYGKAKDGLD